MESVESELETAKDRLRKNVEAVEGINKSIMVFESRHVETVERMKEVRGRNDDPQQNNVGIGIKSDPNSCTGDCTRLLC